jgi:LacI family transcriptional regulator
LASTIKDVAKMAKVSISTVSRVINDSKPVSPEAKRRVLKAIEELEYRPNEIARSLVTKKSNLIGVIVGDIGNSYVAQIVRGIEEIGRMYDYDIVLCSSYGSAETEIKFVQLLRRKQTEGIILVSEIDNKEVVNQITEFKLPFVYLNKYYTIDKSPTVTIDNYEAAEVMMNYLYSKDHRKILYITQKKDKEITIESLKIKAYEKNIKSWGVEPNILNIDGRSIDDGYDSGRMVERIIKEKGITAIFCCQDEIAIGLINYFYDKGIKVPEDMSVVGYGDISLASIYRPTITTIREPYYDLGAVAIRSLLKKLNNEEEGEQTINLPIQLLERESCK